MALFKLMDNDAGNCRSTVIHNGYKWEIEIRDGVLECPDEIAELYFGKPGYLPIATRPVKSKGQKPQKVETENRPPDDDNKGFEKIEETPSYTDSMGQPTDGKEILPQAGKKGGSKK